LESSARLSSLPGSSRRRFLAQCATAAGVLLYSGRELLFGAKRTPSLNFPSQPHERIAIASYPFRNFIAGKENKSPHPLDLEDFAAHIIEKFNINKIEPWTGHFPSTDPKYLEQFRAVLEQAKAMVVNIAVDGEHSPYALDWGEREQAITFSKRWIDAAAAIGSPSVRTNIPAAKDSNPDLARTTDSLKRVVEYAEAKNVVVNLENDNPVSEDPLFLIQVIKKVNNPWLHALPDFGNTLLSSSDPEHAYKGVDSMFGHAYCISHVKEGETDDKGKSVHVDLARTFGFAKAHGYKGYFSMEFDSPGDPYAGTKELIDKTVRCLS
jgi:sugar phosphate isomerase/epimerase